LAAVERFSNPSEEMMVKTEHVQEMLAMTLIGDGLLTAVDPQRHLKLWKQGPEPFKKFVDVLLRHPRMTRCIGAAAVAAGIWWAERQRSNRSVLF
jgi:hypothetical protein